MQICLLRSYDVYHVISTLL